jgi:hypothetical protein
MSFVSGSSTAFSIFDGDAQFRADADKLVRYVSVKLGGGLPGVDETASGTLEPPPHVQVELTSRDVYTSFEEACIEYGAIINAYQAKSSLAAFLGSMTGSLTGGQSRYPKMSLEWARRQAQPFGQEAYVGGDAPLYSGSISLVAGQQDYDLQALVNPTGSTGLSNRMVIRQIFHFSPFSSYRFFGTTSAMNYLNGQFNFQSFTPETVFYMLPVWEDVLRGMQFETSNRVRRSNYSFEMHDNVLKIFPMPQQANTLHFTYQLVDDMDALDDTDPTSFGVSNLSNIPFGNIDYSKINSIGKQWIYKMTLALSKEVLGLKRRKMQTIPIPGGDLSLDGAEMVSDARGEMEALRAELRGLLEEMTYDKLAAKEAEQAEALQRALQGVPLKIYVG